MLLVQNAFQISIIIHSEDFAFSLNSNIFNDSAPYFRSSVLNSSISTTSKVSEIVSEQFMELSDLILYPCVSLINITRFYLHNIRVIFMRSKAKWGVQNSKITGKVNDRYYFFFFSLCKIDLYSLHSRIIKVSSSWWPYLCKLIHLFRVAISCRCLLLSFERFAAIGCVKGNEYLLALLWRNTSDICNMFLIASIAVLFDMYWLWHSHETTSFIGGQSPTCFLNTSLLINTQYIYVHQLHGNDTPHTILH